MVSLSVTGVGTISLGIVKDFRYIPIINKVIIPSTTGSDPLVYNDYENYIQYQISGRKRDTTANLKTFITNLKNASNDNTSCSLTPDLESAVTGYIYSFEYNKISAGVSFLDYRIIINEGISAI